MARITVEDCLQKENNRFMLVQLASKRSKQILGGSRIVASGDRGNKSVVTSLREIAEGKVRFMTEQELNEHKAKEEAKAQEAREALELLSAQSGVPDIFKEVPSFNGDSTANSSNGSSE